MSFALNGHNTSSKFTWLVQTQGLPHFWLVYLPNVVYTVMEEDLGHSIVGRLCVANGPVRYQIPAPNFQHALVLDM